MTSPAPTIAEAARRIARGDLTAEALTRLCLDRIAEREPAVQAWQALDAEGALAEARHRDRSPVAGPMHGIPFGVKDIIEVFGLPTTHGTPIFEGYRSPRDAGCVALLREGGAVCFGKTVSTELAHFHPGKTRNPHDPNSTPGGSSSGSAAAVGAGMVPLALGTQTTGSVLRPASFCGVVGYKPSFGEFTRSGVYDCASSFDTLGLMTQGVEDIVLSRAALLRQPVEEFAPPPLGDLRIGFCRSPFWDQAEPTTRTAIEDAAERLRRAGARISDLELPAGFADVLTLHRTVSGYEFARSIAWERTERGAMLSPVLVEGRAGDGLRVTRRDYHAALDRLAEMRREYASLTRGLDVVLTPSARGEALSGLTVTGDPVFNTLWTALYVPALSLPVLQGPRGMPLGLQLVGQFREDAALCSAAETVRRALS
ncbi:amidase [Roseomonas elaeocarpi]|uniref:Amidase n=1 Tax=Roseomonas elaeocarpi TaxID=907779 RepID=A0ABV6JMY7_9PROT